MIDPHLYVLFLLTGISMAYSPGPSVLYTIISTWKYGQKNMLPRIIGQITALIIYGTVSFVGIRSLMLNFPTFLPGLTLLGALYLAYVAVSSLIESGKIANAYNRPEKTKALIDQSGAFSEALMVGLSNPKIMLVYCVIIPQFTSDQYAIAGQMGILIASQWLIKGSSLFFYVYLADRLQGLFEAPERTAKVAQLFSIILLGIAIYIGWLAVSDVIVYL